MTQLSPAAEAVLQAAVKVQDEWDLAPSIGAAIRAAVEIYAEEGNGEGATQFLLAIAAELEDDPGTEIEGDPYTEIIDFYAAMAARQSACFFHE